MRLRRLGVLWLALSAIVPVWANTQFRARKMTRTDIPGGKGQCDIRLRIEGEAEVTVRGDLVTIRKIAGRDGRDDGSECSAPLPNRPVQGFHFEGVDGRGEMRLVSEPSRQTDFEAVVHIRDHESGVSSYHFRLSWTISSDDSPDRAHFDRPNDERGGLAWNNAVHFGGKGHGTSTSTGDGEQGLADVTVDIDRGGKILVSFHTGAKGRPLSFTGSVIEFDQASIRADVATDDHARLRGSMYLSRNNHGDVYRIALDATNGQDRLHLDWDRK
jgi:hypothetical protein